MKKHKKTLMNKLLMALSNEELQQVISSDKFTMCTRKRAIKYLHNRYSYQ